MNKLALASIAASLGLSAAAFAGDIKVDGKFVSTAPTGTPPLQVDSTTLVPNLNAHFLDGLPASAFSPAVGNVIRVGVTGGDFTSIQAALDSITDAGIDKWYVVLVGPGVYHESIALKDFVSVIGHDGFPETRIHVESAGDVTGVEGAQLSVLSDVWVVARSTDGGDAIGVNAPVFQVQRSRIEAETSPPGQATGLRASGNVTVQLFDTVLTASNGAVNTGLYMETPANVTAVGGEIRGTGGNTNYGVRKPFVSGFGSLDLTDATVSAGGGSVGYGIRSEKGGMVLRQTTVSASGTNEAVGVFNGETTSFSIFDSDISAFDGASKQIGFEQAAGSVTILSSLLFGAFALDVASGAEARVAYSRIFVSLSGSGTFHCIGNYDLVMAPVNCP